MRILKKYEVMKIFLYKENRKKIGRGANERVANVRTVLCVLHSVARSLFFFSLSVSSLFCFLGIIRFVLEKTR